MMDLLPEAFLDKINKDEHNLEYIDSINHIKMFEQHYDGIPRHTKQVYGDEFPNKY